jgi:hypothetical protein
MSEQKFLFFRKKKLVGVNWICLGLCIHEWKKLLSCLCVYINHACMSHKKDSNPCLISTICGIIFHANSSCVIACSYLSMCGFEIEVWAHLTKEQFSGYHFDVQFFYCGTLILYIKTSTGYNKLMLHFSYCYLIMIHRSNK